MAGVWLVVGGGTGPAPEITAGAGDNRLGIAPGHGCDCYLLRVMPVLSGQSSGAQLRLIHGPGASALPDDELLRAFDRGDRAAAAEIFDRLRGVVDGTLVRMLGERGYDHDDLVQTSFEQIVMTLRKHRFAQACSLKAWAGAITARIALGTIRSRRRERGVLDRSDCLSRLSDEWPSGADVERDVSTRSEIDRLRAHLAAISPDRAEVVVLYHLLEQDLASIATMLGISVAAAQSRLVRGRRELHKRMKAEEGTRHSAGGGG